MRTLSLWIFGLLCTSLTGVHGLDTFPKNFVVVKRDDTVTLPCTTNFNGDITWKFGTGDGDDDIDIVGDGQNLTVTQVNEPTLGEYSCWNGDEMLSSTYLLLGTEKEDTLECRAKSYDCNFTCTLTNSNPAVRLGLGHDCIEHKKSCQWIKTSDQLSDGRFQFVVSHSRSPYVEESTMLEVTAEAIDDEFSIQQMTKRFYLRDIVQPDSPQIVKCEEVEQNLNVTVDPPIGWSTPYSYFSLEYEIKYILKDDGKTGISSSTLIPKRTSKLSVRCRESLVPSAWSQWSHWKNVKTGKKLCKCKNTAKFCCPELPSGYLDDCPKRKGKGTRKKICSGVRPI